MVVAERSAEQEQARLAAAYASTGLRLEELWLACLALGGNVGPYEMQAYLAGLIPLSAHEHNVLAQAINEELGELSPPRAPYRHPDQ
jgi:hypothetical protein